MRIDHRTKSVEVTCPHRSKGLTERRVVVLPRVGLARVPRHCVEQLLPRRALAPSCDHQTCVIDRDRTREDLGDRFAEEAWDVCRERTASPLPSKPMLCQEAAHTAVIMF